MKKRMPEDGREAALKRAHAINDHMDPPAEAGGKAEPAEAG
jgi:hypothetical protein